MSSETETLQAYLWGEDKIKSMRDSMTRGRLPNGFPPETQSKMVRKLFGPFADRLIFLADGTEKMEVPKITVLGGWCALRTRDLKMIKEGSLPMPDGQIREYSSVEEVVEWIKFGPAIDQIIEAIGAYSGQNYAAMSEEQLWFERTVATLRSRTGITIDEKSMTDIRSAVEENQQMALSYTTRYLEYISGRKPVLTRIPDYEIMSDLERVRDEMLKAANLTIQNLLDMFPGERGLIPSATVVWGMYTGPYLAVLQNSGYVVTDYAVIVEPWKHASTGEYKSKEEINSRIFQEQLSNKGSENRYLGPNGLNRNLAFAAYYDLMTPDGSSMRRIKSFGEMPNAYNFGDFIIGLRNDPEIASVTLANNPAFIWGVNLLPSREAKAALYKMIEIVEYYQREKAALDSKRQEKANELIQKGADARKTHKTLGIKTSQRVDKLREELIIPMSQQAERVIDEIEKMLIFIFAGN